MKDVFLILWVAFVAWYGYDLVKWLRNPRRGTQRFRVAYKGWFLFCPVWFGEWEGDPFGCPIPRWEVLAPLWNLASYVQQAVNMVMWFIDPEKCGFVYVGVVEVAAFELVY